ncbi:hypothetical protein ACN27J_18525 [Solwaraspora sp. WMMB762]|uniref:hypothetical protein n=1 Tax=Solwaraspora sp. WMMB762 TaxID=3404120 RepID=UPI003B9478B7
MSDGWPVGLVLRELSALYLAGGDPERAGRPPLTVQYRDYATDAAAPQPGYQQTRILRLLHVDPT